MPPTPQSAHPGLQATNDAATAGRPKARTQRTDSSHSVRPMSMYGSVTYSQYATAVPPTTTDCFVPPSAVSSTPMTPFPPQQTQPSYAYAPVTPQIYNPSYTTYGTTYTAQPYHETPQYATTPQQARPSDITCRHSQSYQNGKPVVDRPTKDDRSETARRAPPKRDSYREPESRASSASSRDARPPPAKRREKCL